MDCVATLFCEFLFLKKQFFYFMCKSQVYINAHTLIYYHFYSNSSFKAPCTEEAPCKCMQSFIWCCFFQGDVANITLV